MNIDTKRLQSFLDQFRLIKEKHDEVARANGERFNVFSALGVETAEVRHSAFLAELLNPNGAHAQGAVFLRLFFDMLRAKFVEQFRWELSGNEIDAFEVTAEAHRGDFGRIDILIEKGDRCMVIENKIYAGDQERQLGRYYDYAKAKECVAVIYLTLDGKEPDKYTLYGNETQSENSIKPEYVLRVSYSEDIINWLDECLKATVRLAHIRETLFQYQSLLKQLTGQTLNRRFIMDTNALFSKPENYRLIPELEQAIPAFKSELQILFWNALAKELSAKFEFGTIDDIDMQLDEVKKRVSTYYQPGARNRHNYGIEFAVPEVAKVGDTDIGFSISIHNRIFYGFLVLENRQSADSRSVERCDDPKYEKYRNAVSKEAFPCRNGWYLGHKYRNDLNLEEFPETLMQKLLCDTQRAELIGQLVDEIEASINNFREELNKVR